jgi:sterol desaturase/sphingolipid hydroxylase (fatty acid hydroxylase superfamily)
MISVAWLAELARPSSWPATSSASAKRLQALDFKRADVVRELWTSLRSALVFGTLFGVVYAGLPIVKLEQKGVGAALEFSAWLLFLLVVHDTYFYWAHRLATAPGLEVAQLRHHAQPASPAAARQLRPLFERVGPVDGHAARLRQLHRRTVRVDGSRSP